MQNKRMHYKPYKNTEFISIKSDNKQTINEA